jgi:hypothetical protein
VPNLESQAEAWPVVIGTSLHKDYHVIVAPDFLVAHGTAEVLRNAIHSGSRVTPPDQANITVIRGLQSSKRVSDLYVVFRSQMISRAATAVGARDAAGTTESRGVKILAGLVFTDQYAQLIEDGRLRLSAKFLSDVTINQWLDQYWSRYQSRVPPPILPSTATAIPMLSRGEASLTLSRTPDFDASLVRIRSRPAPPHPEIQPIRPVPDFVQVQPASEAKQESHPKPPVSPSESRDSNGVLWIGLGGLGFATLLWLLARLFR